MTNKKLTILIPLYNSKNYIVETLESIYRNQYDKYNVIILDDFSTDGSAELVKQYITDKPNFRYVKAKEKHGLSANSRNELLTYVSDDTDYVYFMDHDDFIKDDTIPRIMKIANENDYDIIQFNHYVYDKDTKSFKKRSNKANKKGLYKPGDNLSITWIWDKFIKWKLIKDNNIRSIDNSLSEDNTYTIMLLNYAKKIFHTGTYEYYHRILSTSLGRTPKIKKLPLSIYGYTKLLEYMKEHNLKHYKKYALNIFNKKCKELINICTEK